VRAVLTGASRGLGGCSCAVAIACWLMAGRGGAPPAGAIGDVASLAQTPPRGDLLPEPDNPFHAHAASVRKSQTTKATAAAALQKKKAAAAVRAAKAERTARERAAAGLPPLRHRPPRKGAPSPITGATACCVTATGSAAPVASTPPMAASQTGIAPAVPLVVRPAPNHTLARVSADFAMAPPLGGMAPSAPQAVLPTRATTFAGASTAFATSMTVVGETPTAAPVLPPTPSGAVSGSTAVLAMAVPSAGVTPVALPMVTHTLAPSVGVTPVVALAATPSAGVAGAASPVAVQTFPPTLAAATTVCPAAATPPGTFWPSAPVSRGTASLPPVVEADAAAAAPRNAAVASRATAAGVLSDAAAAVGTCCNDHACNLSSARGVKRLLSRIDELEAENRKRRIATNKQVKQLSKRQVADSAEVGDVKRILSEVLKAVNCVGVAIGPGAAVTRDLCRTVEKRGGSAAGSVGGPVTAVLATSGTLSPAILDVPRKAPWAKDMVVSGLLFSSMCCCETCLAVPLASVTFFCRIAGGSVTVFVHIYCA